MTAHSLQPFKDLVSQRCGLSCDGVAEANLVSALALRMKVTASQSASSYFILVSGDEDEFHELVALLTVNETYFFREPAQLTLAADILIPRLLSGRADDRPLRILSAGCSTGEEPYSLAMALREKFGESAGHLVSITAVDIDRQALASACRAEYGEFSFRVLSPELRDRHFLNKPPNRYLLSDAVRGMSRSMLKLEGRRCSP